MTQPSEIPRTEEELRLAQFSLDHANEAVFWLDSDARFIYVNRAACRSLGYSREELYSQMTVHDIAPGFPRKAWAERWEFAKARRTLTFESRHRAKDGRVFPVEVTVNHVRLGGKEYHCSFARNISERKRAEEDMRRRTREALLLQRIAVAANAAAGVEEARQICLDEVCDRLGVPVGHVWVQAPGGGDLESSRQWHLDRPRLWDEFKQQTEAGRLAPLEGLAGRVLAGGESAWAADLAQEPPARREAARACGLRSGFAFPVLIGRQVVAVFEFFWATARDADPEVLDTVGRIAHQLGQTFERLRAEKALRESETKYAQKLESLGVLAGGIAHDFNNLLVGILGYSSLALSELPDDSPARARLSQVVSSAQRAGDLVKQLLAYSGKGKFPPRRPAAGCIPANRATSKERQVTDKNNQAVVLSGGGATGAYEIGVLEGLFENEGFDPSIFTGTSVGTFNAAFMASPKAGESGAATVGRLKAVWEDVIAGSSELGRNGVFRIRGDVLPFLSPAELARDPAKPLTELAGDGLFVATDTLSRLVHFGRRMTSSPLQVLGQLLRVPDLSALISTEPMDDLVRDHIDLPRLRGSRLDFRCVATDWTHVKPRMFTKDEMTDEKGHAIIRASAAIPAIFPEVVIDGVHYVDGGVLMNTPLQPAIDAWLSRPDRSARLTLHVVYLDPAWSEVPLPEVSSTLDVTLRLFTSILAYNANTHIESAGRRNSAIRRQLAEAEIEDAELDEAGSGARLEHPLLTIHKYRPSAQAAGGLPGLLEFTSDHIDELVRQGCLDSRSHDCRNEGCVIPS